ncbi:MAG TPA: cytochrome P450, partial [Acidimicrobiales bacterium]|nr:cytochrome P450 [Acidimicrobiales bacterium]
DSPVRATVRTAIADVTIDGETVRTGEQVLAMLDHANHDPTVFESPGVLDITRDARRHLAFGAGATTASAPLSHAPKPKSRSRP